MTGRVFDLEEGFAEYTGEIESFCTRLERCFEECSSDDPAQVLKWLRAAYQQGAYDMAQDTLSALQDYGTFTAGVEENTYSLSDCFDKAHDNLQVYYTQVFSDTQDDLTDYDD